MPMPVALLPQTPPIMKEPTVDTPHAVTADDIEQILSVGDQFLSDWKECDGEQPAPDRDPLLPLRSAEWLNVRPLLLAAPLLADLAERALDGWVPRDSPLAAQISDLLIALAPHRFLAPSVDAQAKTLPISVETWQRVLSEGLEPGAHWRADILIETPETDCSDGYYWHDTEAHDDQSGPFATLDQMLEDILRLETIDASRLTRHCGLDRWTAGAVLAYEAKVNARLSQQRDTAPTAATPV